MQEDKKICLHEWLFQLLHRSKAFQAILECNRSRAATHIAYLRCDTLSGTCAREHRLLPLVIGKSLFDNNESSGQQNDRGQDTGNSRTVTRFGFFSISNKRERKRKSEGETPNPTGSGRTLSHEMPPRGVNRIVRAPPGDILAVCLTRVVLVDICRTERSLPIQSRERAHISPPATFPGIIHVIRYKAGG
jgi:hypothetical protein